MLFGGCGRRQGDSECLLLHEIHASTWDGPGGCTLSLASLLGRQAWAQPAGFSVPRRSPWAPPGDASGSSPMPLGGLHSIYFPLDLLLRLPLGKDAAAKTAPSNPVQPNPARRNACWSGEGGVFQVSKNFLIEQNLHSPCFVFVLGKFLK